MAASPYKFAFESAPGYASSYVVVRRAGAIKLGVVHQNMGRWLVKQSGERFFFNTRDDAAQALDMADRVARPAEAGQLERQETQ